MEIQGLRTIALLLVATYHIWFDRVSGGVDIFLLISAYLMTRSLTYTSETGGVTRPISFLIRKFARLLPAAVAAIVLILGAMVIVLPRSMWENNIASAMASVLYVENFHLQATSVNYFAANSAFASPFQHFWSLSIQGQVFIIWAFLHLASDLISRLSKIPVRAILLIGFSILFALSLYRSIWLTEWNQTYAYFDTGARLWEFAAGSLLALIEPLIRLPHHLRAAFSWLGVIGTVSCGFALPVASSFPGYVALWPVISAALIIISAGTPTSWGADRLLAHRSLATIGGYTYALYLTHWPALVIYLFVREISHASWLDGIAILTISILLAFTIVRLVERPVARWVKSTKDRPADTTGARRTALVCEIHRIGWRAPLTVALSLALVMMSTTALTRTIEAIRERDRERAEIFPLNALGANAIFHDPEFLDEPIPDPATVKVNWVEAGEPCPEDDPYAYGRCRVVPPMEGHELEHLILSVGSSHIVQFNAALLDAVDRNPGWSLRTHFDPGCNFLKLDLVDDDDLCPTQWEMSEKFIADQHPDVVFVHVTFWAEANEKDVVMDGAIEWIKRMQTLSPDTVFVGVRDNPRLAFAPFDCAMSSDWDNPHCAAPIVWDARTDLQSELAEAGILWADLTKGLCDTALGVCPPARGDVVTFIDDNHVTKMYGRTLAPRLATIMRQRVDWWPEDPYALPANNRFGNERMDEVLNE